MYTFLGYNMLCMKLKARIFNLYINFKCVHLLKPKNMDDRSFFKHVNNSSQIYHGMRGRVGRMFIEDKCASTTLLCWVPPEIFVLIFHQCRRLNRHYSVRRILFIKEFLLKPVMWNRWSLKYMVDSTHYFVKVRAIKAKILANGF